MAPYDILKNGETQEYTVSWKIHCYYVWDEKSVIVNCLPKMREWTPTMIETIRCLYACRYWVHPAIKMSNVMLLDDRTTLHSSVCNRGHHIFCRDNVKTSILHSLPCTIRYHLFGHLKRSLWGHHYANDKALQNAMQQWLLRESNFYCLGIYSCSKVKDGDYTEKWLCLQQCCSEDLWNFLASNV
jgi:hypothetical protein